MSKKRPLPPDSDLHTHDVIEEEFVGLDQYPLEIVEKIAVYLIDEEINGRGLVDLQNLVSFYITSPSQISYLINTDVL